MKGGEIKNPGGINKTIIEINSKLSEKGHFSTVITVEKNTLPQTEYYKGFKIIRVKSAFQKFLYAFSPEIYFYLKKNLKALDPDIIHVHGYHGLLSVEVINLIRRWDSKIPIVFSPHFDTHRSSWAGKYLWGIHKLISRSVFEKSSATVTASKFEADHLIKNYNAIESKIYTITHGVDVFNPIKKSDKKNLINLVYSGFLVDRKGVNFIITALSYLVHELNFKNVSLSLIGEGPEKKSLQRLSKKLMVDEHVIWKSFLSRDEFLNEIIKADILILLSKSEAFGIIVAEALALGTPCIVSKTTALTEFTYENGCFGVDYPPDPEEVSRLILKIYDDNINVGTLTSRIRTWDKVAEDYEKLYSFLIKEELCS